MIKNRRGEINRIEALVLKDNKLASLCVEASKKDKDPNHLERRMSQRAITIGMIKVCVGYGIKKWRYGAKVYTLGDRQLRKTKYERHAEKLRGLTVVTEENSLGNKVNVITACWKL